MLVHEVGDAVQVAPARLDEVPLGDLGGLALGLGLRGIDAGVSWLLLLL